MLRGLGAAALAMSIAVPSYAQTFTMKLGAATVNDGQHEWMKIFKDRMDQKSGGKIKVENYTAGSLGSIPRQIEGVQLGTQEANIVPPAFLVGVDPRFQVLDAPGLFESREQLVATISDPEFRKTFIALGEAKNIKGLSLFYLAPTEIAIRKEVRKLDDLKGLKVRVFGSPMQTLPFDRLGMAGVPMSLDDALPALQAGALDGVFGSIAIFIPFKYHTIAKFLVATNFSYVVSYTFAHKPWFDKLPADLQKLIESESVAIDGEVNQWGFDLYPKAMKTWADGGGEHVLLSPADRTEMMKRLSPIGEEVVKDKPPVKQMYDLMVKTANAKKKT
jgi:TRAP-type C4-dicarboxylate transport system substrate-binding protein